MSQKLLDKIVNHYITRAVLIPKLDKFLLDENTATELIKDILMPLTYLKVE